tara:strand:+ start:2904 stop:3929 length:1026 start_codon:yes stop_codon:yes gene_type:complete
MNLNLIIDPEYINDQLTSSDQAIRVASFFLNFNRKHKRNFIIIQDKDRNIVNMMIHQLKYQFENIDENDSKHLEIFLLALRQGTQDRDFVSEETYDGDIKKFFSNLKNKNIPVEALITEKKPPDKNIYCFKIEDNNKLIDILDKYTNRVDIKTNEDFEFYRQSLFKTFWCSEKITIVALEFLKALTNKKFIGRTSLKICDKNKREYDRGLEFILSAFLNNEKIVKKRIKIEIVAGCFKSLYGYNCTEEQFNEYLERDKKIIDELLSKFKNKFEISCKFVKWNSKKEVHGRRILSNYGGFATEIMPFEVFNSTATKEKVEFYYKNNGFRWIEPEEYTHSIAY